MASPFSRLEEEITCPVCCDVFQDPVVLACSHSFCRGCLQGWWKERGLQDCPVCKKRTKKSSAKHPLPSNLVLRNVCEKYLQEKRQSEAEEEETAAKAKAKEEAAARLEEKEEEEAPPRCAAHGERLRLFCRDDQQLACLVCRDSDRHGGHRFWPLDEASAHCRDRLEEALRTPREKLTVFNTARVKCDQMADHVLLQAQNTDARIQAQFRVFHQFLEAEERSRISALRREEAVKSRGVAQRAAELQREAAPLTDAVRHAEERLRDQDHVSFLQSYKTAVERLDVSLQSWVEPSRAASGLLMDEARHLSNLSFSVWDRMRSLVSYTPVTLDPNTAYPEFTLSDDLTAARLDVMKSQQLPDNTERFDWSEMVLGSEGLPRSGVHSWAVEVGEHPGWSVGVVAESYRRKGDAGGECWLLKSDKRFCAVHCCGNDGGQEENREENVDLGTRRRPRRVRIRLDWSGGTLSFSDVDGEDAGKVLHTFRQTFTETLFPCASVLNHNMSLKMLPAAIRVTPSVL